MLKCPHIDTETAVCVDGRTFTFLRGIDPQAEHDCEVCHKILMHDRLVEACRATLDAIQQADLGGAILWLNPPYQAAGVHETASERLATVLSEATGHEVTPE